MKKQLLILGLALFIGFGFYSCDKKYQVIPAPTPTSSIRDSFEFRYNDNRQSFNFNAAAGGNFVTEEGILFNFPPYGFKNAAGDTIFGQVDVDFSEWLSTPEMILQNRTTTSNGEVLSTGGFFRIEYTSNTSPVFINDGEEGTVAVPTEISNPDMAVFYGNEDATGFVNWTPSLDSAGLTRETTLMSNTLPNGIVQSYYTFNLDSTSTSEWIGCHYLYDVPGSTTELTIGLPERHNNSNTLVFVHFNGIQSVMNCFFNGQNFVSNGRIPAGTSVELVVVSEIDGDYFSKFESITVSSGFSTRLTPEPTTYKDIVDDIKLF